MASLTLAENIVAGLVVFSAGKTSVRLERAVENLETWEADHDCHFGLGRYSVRRSLHTLFFFDAELARKSQVSRQVLKALSIGDAIPILLKYKYFYCCDEDDYWEAVPDGSFDKASGKISAMSFRSYRMQRYFSEAAAPEPEEVVRSLRKLGFSEDYLLKCTRPGASS